MSLQAFYKRHTLPLSLLLIILVAVLLSMLIVSQRTQAYQNTLKSQISAHQSVLQSIAVEAAQNRTENAIGVKVTDCPQTQRAAFDSLLGRLDSGLSQVELFELDDLFSACAHIQAERKAIVVDRFSREVQILGDYTDQLTTISGTNVANTYSVTSWQSLLEYEQTQSQAFYELVIAQKAIIDSLLDGNTADSPDMLAILDNVRTTQETLSRANIQASTLRAELIDQ